ncbi:hypothetical protein [Tenacibaculum finnmarkense]|uniref:hypothetical protein n=1 Tax=Tenacibaculum finnmarkense TaxID=2781243 RepID=UPI001EFC200C|nr:hypothetical protein [Tenacibaculum finnmarkense]MCG8750502.1 hypothetical protein [Tenacibaculum finnmarkense]MCG8755529.1 hypothetical protein [Tenacibaculum finnmarkense]MCG8784106.1 hypothetical protein [Tenacibaculum finnmarkense]MCG8786409.1 hypothetical protein [Tenacibaculum finnmarkense]
MNNSDNSGGLILLMYAVTIGISIYSGILAWDWISPNSFIGAIGFLIAWGLFSKIGHILAMGLIAILGGTD